MNLEAVEIRNFRSISHLQLTPRNFTTFIGKNSCGKSNILRALQFFFTANTKNANEEDLCKFADEGGTWVECIFNALTVEEREELSKYVRADGKIRVRRVLRREGENCVTKLHGYIQQPQEAWLQEDYPDYADAAKWEQLGIEITQYAALGRSGRITKDTYAEFRKNYIQQHAGQMNFREELSETELRGRQSTALNSLPHFIFIPAVGDIISAIYGRQTSLLNEMVSAIVEGARNNPGYLAAQGGLDESKKLINPSDSRLIKLTLIEQELANKLRSWPGTTVSIRTEIEDLAKILLAGLVLKVDDGHDTELSEKGDGIQRQVLFRVFQLYADYRAARGIFSPEEGQAVVERGPCIIAFEEPELFLHPQAQEQFYDDLLVVAERDQVLLATHSNHLIRLDRADGLHVVRRESMRHPTGITRASSEWLQAGDEQRLKEIQFCSGDASKVFFADKVILTEGFEDFIYIAGTANSHAHCMDRRVTIVHVNGIQNIPTLQRVLNAFRIRYVVACDQDPGNQNTQNALVTIRGLIEIARRSGIAASLEEFRPNIPVEAQGQPPIAPKRKYDSDDAWELIRDRAPTLAFSERIRGLYAV